MNRLEAHSQLVKHNGWRVRQYGAVPFILRLPAAVKRLEVAAVKQLEVVAVKQLEVAAVKQLVLESRALLTNSSQAEGGLIWEAAAARLK